MKELIQKLMNALALLDTIPVTGRNNRMNMLLAEQHISDAANALAVAAEKEAQDGNV